MHTTFDSIVFDLDGTLWDASATCTKAWNEALKANATERIVFDQKVIRSFSGMKIENIMTSYLSTVPEHQHQSILKSYHEQERLLMRSFGGELFPDVKYILSYLRKKYKLFIVSNCAAGYIENFMSFHGLNGLFTDFESSGNTGLPKSENIRSVADRNHLRNPVYIGDTIWDYEAAHKAGVPFICAAYGFGQVDNPESRINSFSELENIL
jgi:phosphoglycolate phosphatase